MLLTDMILLEGFNKTASIYCLCRSFFETGVKTNSNTERRLIPMIV